MIRFKSDKLPKVSLIYNKYNYLSTFLNWFSHRFKESAYLLVSNIVIEIRICQVICRVLNYTG